MKVGVVWSECHWTITPSMLDRHASSYLMPSNPAPAPVARKIECPDIDRETMSALALSSQQTLQVVLRPVPGVIRSRDLGSSPRPYFSAGDR